MKTAIRHLAAALALLCASALSAPASQAGSTLDQIKRKGEIACGVSSGVPGFSAADSRGNWSGLDVDVCKALAAAVLGDAAKVKWVPLGSQQRFSALQAGEVDILSRNTTWTLTRDASLGLVFTAITYYDGQGFLVPKRFGLSSASQLRDADICVQSGTTTEKNLADHFRRQGIRIKPVVFEKFDASLKAFFNGRCVAYTTDASSLAGIRAREAPKPEDYVILPETISKEPLGPMVRRGDDEWFTIVKWVIYALIEAEELGITRDNADKLAAGDPVAGRLLGKGEDLGKPLGLDAQWAYRAIRAVGNYGEIFERNLGAGSPLGLPRGHNALWNQGGLMYAPPLR